MRREALVQARRASWERLERGLSRLSARSPKPKDVSELAGLYRQLASDLMIVRRDHLGQDLEAKLDRLATEAHNRLYGGSAVGNKLRLASLLFDFPGAVRRNARLFWLAFLLFFGPALVTGALSATQPGFSTLVLGEDGVKEMEKMHDVVHEEDRGLGGGAGGTGFYVNNNIGIAFRCFATGALFGLGSVVVLLFNGLTIGAAIGHLIGIGRAEVILTFTAAHSAWELIAIVISGAAGLQLGGALLSPGARTRLGKVRSVGLELLRQVAGAAVFLAIAALLEAWVSPSSLPRGLKYGLGIGGALAVAYILALAGRGRPPPADVEEARRAP